MTLISNQIAALEKSITNKWELIIIGHKTREFGVGDCDCCKQYRLLFCENCPIGEYSAISNCGGTPYFKWAQSLHDDFRIPYPLNSEQFLTRSPNTNFCAKSRDILKLSEPNKP